jgi:hypothetical protein
VLTVLLRLVLEESQLDEDTIASETQEAVHMLSDLEASLDAVYF